MSYPPATASTPVAIAPGGNLSTIDTGVLLPSIGASPRLVRVSTRRPLPPSVNTSTLAPSPAARSVGTARPASSPTLVLKQRRLDSGLSDTSTLPGPYADGASSASSSCAAVSEFGKRKKKQKRLNMHATDVPCREMIVAPGPACRAWTLSAGSRRLLGREPVSTCHHGSAAEAEATGSAASNRRPASIKVARVERGLGIVMVSFGRSGEGR